jgi:hypothetical protein
MEWKPVGRRTEEDQGKDGLRTLKKIYGIMGIRGWRQMCKERAEWKKMTEKAKTYSGL